MNERVFLPVVLPLIMHGSSLHHMCLLSTTDNSEPIHLNPPQRKQASNPQCSALTFHKLFALTRSSQVESENNTSNAQV